MNELELKQRAQRLANRLNAMGFTKGGKPMVIDQAYELLAAAEGYRNQHVLRSKLAPVPLVIPRVLDEEFAKAVMVQHTVDDSDFHFANEVWEHIVEEAAKRGGTEPVTIESEYQAGRAWDAACNRMGWNADSQVIHLEGFLRDSGLMSAFAKYAERAAEEESSFAEEAEPGSSAQTQFGESRADRDARYRAIADAAFENYDFGAEVVEANGWETVSGTGEFRRAVFLATPKDDTRKVIFIVEVNEGTTMTSVTSA
jgi:hypothetical protein